MHLEVQVLQESFCIFFNKCLIITQMPISFWKYTIWLDNTVCRQSDQILIVHIL